MQPIVTLRAAWLVALATAPALGQTETVNGRTIIQDAEQISIIRGNHPRLLGQWPQYGASKTALRKNVIITDVITPDSPWESALGKPVPTHAAGSMDAGDHSLHNHYQNLLSEVWNFAPNVNAVSMWGDSLAAAKGAKAWGAFFSARSHCESFLNPGFSQWAPPGVDLGCGPDFDAHLIGIEVDVLNYGKPGVWPNLAKTGVQIVGFGKPNMYAIEVLCEDTAADRPDRRGRWATALCVNNSLTDDGRLIVADFEKAAVGLDFSRALFKYGALTMRTDGRGTGIVCNGGKSGEMFGGVRGSDAADDRHWLTLRAGDGGIRLTNHDGTREMFAVDNFGAIRLTGDVFVNSRRVSSDGFAPASWRMRFDDKTWLWIVGVLGAAVVWLVQKVIRLQIRLSRFIRRTEELMNGRPVPA